MKKWMPWVMGIGLATWCEAKELRRTFEDTAFLGHGEAGIANVSGIPSLYYNPAGLGRGEDQEQQLSILDPQVIASDEILDAARNPEKYRNLKLTPTETVDQVEGKNLYVGAQNFSGGVVNHIAFGLIGGAYSNLSIDLLDVNLDKSQLLLEAVSHYGFVSGYGKEVAKNLYVGASLYVLEKTDIYYPGTVLQLGTVFLNKKSKDGPSTSELLKDQLSQGKGRGIGVDVGMIYTKPHPYVDISYGITVQDVGTTTYSDRNVRPDKQMVTVGTSLDTNINQQNMVASLDYLDVLNVSEEATAKHILFGVSSNYHQWVGFSMGLHQGYPVAGTWVSVGVLKVEYSYTVSEVGDRVGENPSRRQAFHARLGWDF